MPYAAAADAATTFVLRIACGAYPLPLHIRGVVLRRIAAADEPLLVNRSLVVLNEVVLSLPPPMQTTTRQGWVPPGTLPYRSGVTIRLGMTVSCGGEWPLEVTIPVLPEVLPSLVTSTAVVRGVAEWTTAAGSSAAAGSVGRAAAAQRLLLCSGAEASSGGLLALSVGSDSELSYARGAVIGNGALLAAAGVLLLGGALFFGVVTGAGAGPSLLRVALPSSLLPVWTATLPTTAAAMPTLRNDVLYFVLGTVTAAIPLVCLCAVPFAVSRWRLVPHPIATDRISSLFFVKHCPAVAKWHRWVTGRRLQWLSGKSERAPAAARVAWLVLLDHNAVWYPAVDAAVLIATCVLGAVSGMGDAVLCQSVGWTMLALCLAQLGVCAAFRPMTSLVANVHAIVCLVLTCSALALQCVAMLLGDAGAAPPAAVITTSTILQLFVIGLSLVKTADDVWRVLRSAWRFVSEIQLHHVVEGDVASAAVTDEETQMDTLSKRFFLDLYDGLGESELTRIILQDPSSDDDTDDELFGPTPRPKGVVEPRRLVLREELQLMMESSPL